MYNFSIPSVLKAWIDHIARAGRTFRYTETGPVGLLTDKKVFIVTARGGFYAGDGAMKGYDFHEPYLRTVLGFLGLDNISFIYVEGQALGPEIAASGIVQARNSIGAIVPAALAA
jgi:FMN-dependent NADH-azoreductase